MRYLLLVFIFIPILASAQQIKIGKIDTVERPFLYEYVCSSLYFNDIDYVIRESQHVELNQTTNFPNYGNGLYIYLHDVNTVLSRDTNYIYQEVSGKVDSIFKSKKVAKNVLLKYIYDLRKFYFNDTIRPRGRWYPYIKSNMKMSRMYIGDYEVVIPNITMINKSAYIKTKIPCYAIIDIFHVTWER